MVVGTVDVVVTVLGPVTTVEVEVTVLVWVEVAVFVTVAGPVVIMEVDVTVA